MQCARFSDQRANNFPHRLFLVLSERHCKPCAFITHHSQILLSSWLHPLIIQGRNRGKEKTSEEGERKRKRVMGDLFIWLISFFILIALFVLLIYQLTCLADLEFDYINPYDSSSRINKVVLPEFFLQGFLCLFYLLTGHWLMSLLCAPYLYYNVRLYTWKQHLVDVTEIFNLLHREKKQRYFKLAYLVVLLFFSLFWIILSALEDEDD